MFGADQSLLMRFVKRFPDIAAIRRLRCLFFTATFENGSPYGIAACEIAQGMACFTDKPITLKRGKNDPGIRFAVCGDGDAGRRPRASRRLRHARYHGRRPEFLRRPLQSDSSADCEFYKQLCAR